MFLFGNFVLTFSKFDDFSVKLFSFINFPFDKITLFVLFFVKIFFVFSNSFNKFLLLYSNASS